MKKTVSLLLAMLLIILCCFTGGCQNLKKTVLVNGSSSTETVMKELRTEFIGQNRMINVELNYTDSNIGIQTVLNGKCEIGLSSRVLTAPETFSGLNEYVFAYDAIAIIVNTENPVTDLSMESLYKIFTGEISNWDEIGGDFGAIETVGRESGSGTRNCFESLIGASGECDYNCEKSATNEVIEYVSKNTASVGYISVTAVSDYVKIMKINGVQPCVTTVKNRFYPLRRPFVLVTSNKIGLSAEAQKFYDFIISSKASEIILSSGAVPVN